MFDESDYPAAVVCGGVFGEESGSGWGVVGVAEVGQDLGGGGRLLSGGVIVAVGGVVRGGRR